MIKEYLDKNSKPISKERWEELRKDPDYVVIATDIVPTANKPIRIMTYWLGKSILYGPDGIAIFKTILEDENGIPWIYTHTTLEAAKTRHQQILDSHTNEYEAVSRLKQVAYELVRENKPEKTK